MEGFSSGKGIRASNSSETQLEEIDRLMGCVKCEERICTWMDDMNGREIALVILALRLAYVVGTCGDPDRSCNPPLLDGTR